MVSEPCFETIAGKPSERCVPGCPNDAKYYANWERKIVVAVCERHKRESERKEWPEVAMLISSCSGSRSGLPMRLNN